MAEWNSWPLMFLCSTERLSPIRWIHLGFIFGSCSLSSQTHSGLFTCFNQFFLILLFLPQLFLSPVQWIFVGDHFPRNCWQVSQAGLPAPSFPLSNPFFMQQPEHSSSLKLDPVISLFKCCYRLFFRVKSRLSNLVCSTQSSDLHISCFLSHYFHSSYSTHWAM